MHICTPAPAHTSAHIHASTPHTHMQNQQANKNIKIEAVLSTFHSSVLRFNKLCVTGDGMKSLGPEAPELRETACSCKLLFCYMLLMVGYIISHWTSVSQMKNEGVR